MSTTVPLTVYKTPNPELNVSELYTVYAEELPGATNRDRRWVVKERYGAWDEAESDPKQKFKINVSTISPTDPTHCLTLDEAERQIQDQVRLRVRSGFKYLFVRDFYAAPWFKRYEILPDGSQREMP